MTEQEIVQAIKRGAPFFLHASGPSSARQDVLMDLERCTNIALSQLRGDVERLAGEVETWRRRYDSSTETCDGWMQEAISLRQALDAALDATPAPASRDSQAPKEGDHA